MYARECPSCRTLWPPAYGECVQCGVRTQQVNKRPISDRDARRRIAGVEFEREYQKRERQREAAGEPSPEDLGRRDAARDLAEIRRFGTDAVSNTFGIWLPGQPVPAVRPKVTRWSTFYPGKYGDWLPWATDYAKTEWQYGELEGALSARLVFMVDRPKTHFGTGRNDGLVRPAMRTKYPYPGGDIDNYVKGPLDALKGVAFHDDKQVTALSATKRWTGPGETAGVLVCLDTDQP